MASSRRQFLGQSASAGLAAAAPKRPNILFLMTDQMQGRVLDPAHPCKTPHLDRLARRGVRFVNAYTPNPVCSPARASLMTGRLPHSQWRHAGDSLHLPS
jgi:arylsulfatase A-like enzyme